MQRRSHAEQREREGEEMRITLLGVLGFLAVAALLLNVGYKLQQKTEQNEPPPPMGIRHVAR
jgi:hypothetical protein